MNNVRDAVDQYSFVYAFSFENMRSSQFKTVRKDWQDSRFFLGKNKIMAVALGRSEEEAYRENLHLVASDLKGNVGLLCTNKPKSDVFQ